MKQNLANFSTLRLWH